MIVKEGTPIAGGKYIVEIRLGKGGQAEVWKAQQLGVGGFSKDVVIKIVHAKALENPKVHQIFLNEAHLAAQLQHPNIVEIYDIGQHNELDYIVMELIRGQDLGHILETHVRKTGQPIPWTLVAQMMLGVCKGLFYAHNSKGRDGLPLNLIHRDLKPENMLLTVDGFIKIIDFGMAKASNVQHKTQTGIIKGTPSYMSPEQITARPQDLRSDLFALGIIMYELCTGQRPFLGDMLPTLIYAILENKPESLRKRAPRVPESFDQLVLKLLEKKPDDRFEDARQVQRALEKIIKEDAPAGFHRDSLSHFAQRYAQPTEQAPIPAEPEKNSDPLVATDLVRPGYTPSPAPLLVYGNQTPNPMRQPPAPLHTLFPENPDEAMEPTMSAPLEEVRKAAQENQLSKELLSPGATLLRPNSTELSSIPPHELPPDAVVGMPTEQTLRDNFLPTDDREKLRQILLGYDGNIPPTDAPNSAAPSPAPPKTKADTKPTDPNASSAYFSNEETEDLSSALENNPDLLIPPAPPPLPTDIAKKSPSAALLDAISHDNLPEANPLSFLDAFSAPLSMPSTNKGTQKKDIFFPGLGEIDEEISPKRTIQDPQTSHEPSKAPKEQEQEEQEPSAITISSVLAVPDTSPPQNEQETKDKGPESQSTLPASSLEQTPLHLQDSVELQTSAQASALSEDEKKISSELAFQATAPLIEGVSPEEAAAFFPPQRHVPSMGAEISSAFHQHDEFPRTMPRSLVPSPPLSDEISMADIEFKFRHREDTLLPTEDLYEEEDLGGESTTIQAAPKVDHGHDEVVAHPLNDIDEDDVDEFAPTGILLPHRPLKHIDDDDDDAPTNIYKAPIPKNDFAIPAGLRASSSSIHPPIEEKDEVVFGNFVALSQGELPALSYRFEEAESTPLSIEEEPATLRQGFSPLAGGTYNPNQPPPEYYQMMQASAPRQLIPLPPQQQEEFSLDLDEIAKEPAHESGGDFTVLDVKLLEKLQRRKQRLKWIWIGGNIIVILTLVGIILALTMR